jgi:hypothetical protein
VINSALGGGLYGAVLGAASGAASRWAHKRVLHASGTAFYSVFVAGIFFRLAVLVGAVCLLRHEKYIIIISFASFLVLAQMFLRYSR